MMDGGYRWYHHVRQVWAAAECLAFDCNLDRRNIADHRWRCVRRHINATGDPEE